MAEKTAAPQTVSTVTGVAPGFYVFLGVMGLAFLLILGYMVSLYLS